ncbi:MAG: universal stress protein [Antricoccus sp.]
MTTTTRSDPVVVGIDGSDNSTQALQWAAEYARRYELPLVAIAAWGLPTAGGYSPYYSSQDDHSDELQTDAQTMLERTIREAGMDEAQVQTRVIRGHPAKVLLAAAEAAQLLVVGSRGHGGFVGMLLGSVSHQCTQHAPCPVVVVPAEQVTQPASSS